MERTITALCQSIRDLREMEILNITLKEFLENSLKSDTKDLCRGWDYLKDNIIVQLNTVMQEDYWQLKYNSEKVDFILKHITENLDDALKRQLGSFVYVKNTERREAQEKAEKEQLEIEMTRRGFRKIYPHQKELDKMKVVCVLNVQKIGPMGSFDETEEIIGTLQYSDHQNSLFLLPKRCRTRGFLVRDFAYVKELV